MTLQEIEMIKEEEKKRRADMILSAFDELLNPEPVQEIVKQESSIKLEDEYDDFITPSSETRQESPSVDQSLFQTNRPSLLEP